MAEGSVLTETKDFLENLLDTNALTKKDLLRLLISLAKHDTNHGGEISDTEKVADNLSDVENPKKVPEYEEEDDDGKSVTESIFSSKSKDIDNDETTTKTRLQTFCLFTWCVLVVFLAFSAMGLVIYLVENNRGRILSHWKEWLNGIFAYIEPIRNDNNIDDIQTVIPNSTSCSANSFMLRDGVCDDVTNVAQCLFDSGDCCLDTRFMDASLCLECMCKVTEGLTYLDFYIYCIIWYDFQRSTNRQPKI